MSGNKTAAVLGGNGFVGQYVVQCLAQVGYTVRVASRRPDQGALLRPWAGGAGCALLCLGAG